MKLIKPAEFLAPAVTIGRFYGRLRLTTCEIDFGHENVQLGKRIEILRFGDITYRGVIPLKKNNHTYECVIEQVEQ